MNICDVCDYGMLSADAEYYPCGHCIEGNSFSISEHDKQTRADVINEFIKDVLIELNALAENDDYYFDKDNANLVSTVLYSQFDKLKGNE